VWLTGRLRLKRKRPVNIPRGTRIMLTN